MCALSNARTTTAEGGAFQHSHRAPNAWWAKRKPSARPSSASASSTRSCKSSAVAEVGLHPDRNLSLREASPSMGVIRWRIAVSPWFVSCLCQERTIEKRVSPSEPSPKAWSPASHPRLSQRSSTSTEVPDAPKPRLRGASSPPGSIHQPWGISSCPPGTDEAAITRSRGKTLRSQTPDLPSRRNSSEATPNAPVASLHRGGRSPVAHAEPASRIDQPWSLSSTNNFQEASSNQRRSKPSTIDHP